MLYATWLCALGEGRTAGAPAMDAMRRFKLTILKLRLTHNISQNDVTVWVCRDFCQAICSLTEESFVKESFVIIVS